MATKFLNNSIEKKSKIVSLKQQIILKLKYQKNKSLNSRIYFLVPCHKFLEWLNELCTLNNSN